MSLGNKLKEGREKNGLSQDAFAKLLGIKSGLTINNWELNLSNPSVRKLKSICKTLAVSPEFILDLEMSFADGQSEVDIRTYLENTPSLGARIHKVRELKRMTIESLTALAGVKSPDSISNWENNLSVPNIDAFRKLCIALRVSPKHLLNCYPPDKQ